MSYCEKCDLEHCEHTTGAGARYDASIGTPYYSTKNTPPAGGSGRGPTIDARFDGHCKGCGRPYDAGTPITHDRDVDGWVAECCS